VQTAFELGTDGVGCIAVGYDGTPPSESALALAIGMARRSSSRLVVVIVTVPAAAGGSAAVAGAVHAARHEETLRLTELARQACAREGVPVEVAQRDGDAAREIEHVAEGLRADVIIVGRSASRTHELIGSVAIRLVKHAGRPVVVVP
jgi:nucleotide-binding universal stress UspA family protein